ncbi:MAG: serine/threonine protein kinase, partial [Nitrosomonas ureae]
LALAEQLFNVLSYLHGKGVIHRDIKPSNIKLNASRRLYLVDFGIAKPQAISFVTQSWAKGIGSPGFAPLEQYQGRTDARSDIYSLGAVFYFLLTAEIPLEASFRASGDLLTPPSRLRSGISKYTEFVVLRALALQPSQRFQTVADMQHALLAQKTTSLDPAMFSSSGYRLPDRNRLVFAGILSLVVLLIASFLVAQPISQNRKSPSSAFVTPGMLAVIPILVTRNITVSSSEYSLVTETALQPNTSFPTNLPTATPLPPTATPIPATVTPTPIPMALVLGSNLIVRTGPGQVYPDSFSLARGTEMVVTGRDDTCTWFLITAPGGYQGWIEQSEVNANVAGCSPAYIPAPPLPTATPIPTKTPSFLASNTSQFTGSQGSNGWWYQVEQGRNSGNFIDFPSFGTYQTNDGRPARNCWLTSQEAHVRICPEGEIHPGGTGRIAYRWRSDIARRVLVNVHAHKIDTSCGHNDGVWIGIFRVPFGQPPAKLGEFSLSGADNRDRPGNTYTWNADLNSGDSIMVMIDVARTPACDMTRLYIDVN